ncbi:MAG: hypothetical protein O2782_01365 [bacterium]|nr:hypothetical protein [bacterium]
MVVICLATGALYAASYARVFGQTDPRLVALDHTRGLFAPGARLGYEQTGVQMVALTSGDDFVWKPDPLGLMFNLNAFLLAADKVHMAYSWLESVDGVVIVDVARARHFAAVAAEYPVEAGFYQQLYAGQAGFEIVADVDQGPGLGPLALNFRSTDPSFDGFDHPRVTVLRRTDADLQRLSSEWISRLRSAPTSLDTDLLCASRALHTGDMETSRRHLDAATRNWPQHKLPTLLRCELLLREGRVAESNELWNRFSDELGPEAGLFWQHEILGLEFAGKTLNQLGAHTIGERCLAAATTLRD